jgi:hypothetical protein
MITDYPITESESFVIESAHQYLAWRTLSKHLLYRKKREFPTFA